MPEFDWDELDRRVGQEWTKPSGFTARDYAARHGISESQARHRVLELVRKGILKIVWIDSRSKQKLYDVAVEGEEL